MFKKWMSEIDAAVGRLAWVSVYDLPDYNFRDAYESGDTPEQVAMDILEAEGWDFDYS